ncbi:unnamed protein product [Phytophthora lilii]|uniref:Unnamed protein product n=1 Tax=Phytophthora lilii TaxID=2077276 RepID=A0A9W6WRF2_9STRA|nr:unnamed protein product [Phytophthora lilii]
MRWPEDEKIEKKKLENYYDVLQVHEDFSPMQTAWLRLKESLRELWQTGRNCLTTPSLRSQTRGGLLLPGDRGVGQRSVRHVQPGEETGTDVGGGHSGGEGGHGYGQFHDGETAIALPGAEGFYQRAAHDHHDHTRYSPFVHTWDDILPGWMLDNHMELLFMESKARVVTTALPEFGHLYNGLVRQGYPERILFFDKILETYELIIFIPSRAGAIQGAHNRTYMLSLDVAAAAVRAVYEGVDPPGGKFSKPTKAATRRIIQDLLPGPE